MTDLKKFVGLEYYSFVVPQFEIDQMEKELQEMNIQFDSRLKDGLIVASLEDYMLHVALFLNPILVNEYFKGIMTNAAWDALCLIIHRIWFRVKRKAPEISGKRPFNFGLKVQKDRFTKFEFKIKTELSEESSLEAIRTVLQFIKETPSKKEHSLPIHADFDEDEKWKIIDIQAEMLEKLNKRTKK